MVTLSGLEKLARTTTEENVIVWLNEHFGEIARDGRSFEEFRQTPERRLTFEEAIRMEESSLVSSRRLKIVRRGSVE